MEKFRQVIKDMKESVITKASSEELINTWAEVAAKQVNDSLTLASEEVKDIGKAIQDVKVARLEEEDKEARRNNIIFYRVPESSAASGKDRIAEDAAFCTQLLLDLQAGIVPEDIRKVFRLGRRIDDGNPQRGPRPILVQLSSKAAKNLIMENLYKMKSMEVKFRSVIIAHDMTKAEREDCKALVEVARQRTENESGDWIHRVRGPPGHMVIVRMRKV